jgi:ubiquinone/menaquinone biosynthesis C-methylase UbiE
MVRASSSGSLHVGSRLVCAGRGPLFWVGSVAKPSNLGDTFAKTEANMTTHIQHNTDKYADIYGNQKTVLRYPADWIIRFHNMYMRKNIPTGRVLDYGCGSGNNSKFFMEQGYEVLATEIVPEALPLVKENAGSSDHVTLIKPDTETLPFPNNHFDFIFSNQVLYYLASGDKIRAVSNEMRRCLKPGGVVFHTMIGPRNHSIPDYASPLGNNVHELKITGAHRLAGYHMVMYVAPDEDDLCGLFPGFDKLTVGYFDQSMFEMRSNFHWIYVGKKPVS